MVAMPKPYIPKPEYVALENQAQTKSEYVNGEIYAMAGGNPTHAQIGGNAYAALHSQLRGKPCRPFNSDLRVEVLAAEATFYPDASVACPPLEYSPDDPYALTNPVVLIEVLSPSAKQFDRGAKWTLIMRPLRSVITFSSRRTQSVSNITQGKTTTAGF